MEGTTPIETGGPAETKRLRETRRKGRRPFTDVLLYLSVYPETASPALIARAVRLCAQLGDRICAAVEEPDFDVPVNPLAARLGGVLAAETDQDRRAAAAREKVVAKFNAAARAAGVKASSIVARSQLGGRGGEHLARATRVHDLCVIAYVPGEDGQRSVARTALFNGGRPVLLVPSRRRRTRLDGAVLVAWDGGRAAARAIADAIPLLGRASKVILLTITGTRRAPPDWNAQPMLEYLASHGIAATVREVAAEGSSEDALFHYIQAKRPDLLIMGGYDRPPAGEFLLGGMTERIIQQPPVPVFLSH